jgi:hypothetical protein
VFLLTTAEAAAVMAPKVRKRVVDFIITVDFTNKKEEGEEEEEGEIR